MLLKLNGTHPLLVCADDVNPLGDDINVIKKNTGAIIDDRKSWSEVNTDGTYYSYMLSRHRSAEHKDS
jgi:hypothetical protein